MQSHFIFASCAAILSLASCSQVSDSPVPVSKLEIPASFRYKNNYAKNIEPNWWVSFKDPKLNELQTQLTRNNLDLKVAYSNYKASLGALGISEAELLPRVESVAEVSRNRDSDNVGFPLIVNPTTNMSFRAQFGYEVDLWGRVSQTIRMAKAEADVQRLLIEDVRLAMQTQLTRQYMALRFLNAESSILEAAVETRREAAKLIKTQLDGGIGNALDLSRANSILSTAKADLEALQRQRAALESSISILVGVPASQFRIANTKSAPTSLPLIPSGVPANVLTRRPDIRAAYSQLEAKSANLGVAKAAPYPKLRLTGSAGLLSINRQDFLNKSSSIFSIGPSLDIPIFAGGRFEGNLTKAKAEQEASLARFQKASLVAFAEVESALSAVQSLEKEYILRKEASKNTQESFDLAAERFKEGSDSYLSVIDAERERLLTQRALLRTNSERYAATIELVRALGGGFSSRK